MCCTVLYPVYHDMETVFYYSSIKYLLLILGGVVFAVGEAQYPSCSLCLAVLSSSFRGILRYSQARWDNPSSELWIVPWGPLPAGSGWIISKEKHPEGIMIRYPDQLSWLLLKWMTSSCTLSTLQMSEVLTVFLAPPARNTDPELMTTGRGLNRSTG